MELRQLEYLVAVADAASFTRAAAELQVAQPGVSAQIRRLERELGQTLLDRSGRTVRVTAAGAAVLPYARAALSAVAGARGAVDRLAGLLGGRVSVGMVVSCSFGGIPETLAEFHRAHPQVEITLSEDNSDRLVEALREGRLDLAFVATAGAPRGIETQTLVEEPLVVAVTHGDPLAGRATISLDDLRDRALVCLPRGTGIRGILERQCVAAGFLPQVRLEASNPNVVALLAARGLGAAVLPESVAVAHERRLKAIRLRPALRGRVELAWRSEGPTSPAGAALLAHARARLKRAG
jgi:DNA-binding transcriptional LysR family regulator